MARALTGPREKLAVRAATDQLVDQYGSQSKAARASGLSQQRISAVLQGKIGFDTLLALSRHFGHENVGDFVERFAPEPDGGKRGRRRVVIVGNLPGWAEACAEARRHWGGGVPDWAWNAAGAVILPVRPQSVSPALAYELAHFLARFCQASGIMPKAVPADEADSEAEGE